MHPNILNKDTFVGIWPRAITLVGHVYSQGVSSVGGEVPGTGRKSSLKGSLISL